MNRGLNQLTERVRLTPFTTVASELMLRTKMAKHSVEVGLKRRQLDIEIFHFILAIYDTDHNGVEQLEKQQASS